MSNKRKQYDYAAALNPDHSDADFIDYRRILRKLVRDAVLLGLNDALAAPSKTGPEHAKDIAKWLIP